MDAVSVYSSALTDRPGTIATVIFGGNHSDRRNHSLSVASLFTLQLQTDPWLSYAGLQVSGAVLLTGVCVTLPVEALYEHTHAFFTPVILKVTVPFDPQTRMSVRMV